MQDQDKKQGLNDRGVIKLRFLQDTAAKGGPPCLLLYKENRSNLSITPILRMFSVLMNIRHGASGDTELFEEPFNINGLEASEQQFILYISFFGRLFFRQPPFFYTQNKCSDWG